MIDLVALERLAKSVMDDDGWYDVGLIHLPDSLIEKIRNLCKMIIDRSDEVVYEP